MLRLAYVTALVEAARQCDQRLVADGAFSKSHVIVCVLGLLCPCRTVGFCGCRVSTSCNRTSAQFAAMQLIQLIAQWQRGHFAAMGYLDAHRQSAWRAANAYHCAGQDAGRTTAQGDRKQPQRKTYRFTRGFWMQRSAQVGRGKAYG